MADNETITQLKERIKNLNNYIERHDVRIERLENDLYKHRKALVEIENKAHDILRPIPFQDEDDENVSILP